MLVSVLRRALLLGLAALPIAGCIVEEPVRRPRPVYVAPPPPVVIRPY